MRLAISFALMASGWTLSAIGFSADAAQGSHTAQTVWRLGAAMFLAGPIMCLFALAAVVRYPLSRKMMIAGGG
jgi:Na+/melibiose symporter-like transporter